MLRLREFQERTSDQTMVRLISKLYKESNKMHLFIRIYSKICTPRVSNGHAVHHQVFTYHCICSWLYISCWLTSCSASEFQLMRHQNKKKIPNIQLILLVPYWRLSMRWRTSLNETANYNQKRGKNGGCSLWTKDSEKAKKNLVTIYEPHTEMGWYGTCQHLFVRNPAKEKEFQSKKILWTEQTWSCVGDFTTKNGKLMEFCFL